MSESDPGPERMSACKRLRISLGIHRPLSWKRRTKARLRYSELIEARMRPPVLSDATLVMYRELIAYIRHENELIHQRTTWFLAIQGVLAAGAGIVYISEAADCARSWLAYSSHYTSDVFKALSMWSFVCTTGIITAAVGRNSIDAALHAQDTINQFWMRIVPIEERILLPDMMGGKGDYEADIGGGFAGTLPQFTLSAWWTMLLGPWAIKAVSLFLGVFT